jgi:hypothetical protein
MSVKIPIGMEHPLNLDPAQPSRRRGYRRKRQSVRSAALPVAVHCLALACLVPALDEIVMNVACRRASHFQIDVMVLRRAPSDVGATDEGCLRWKAGIGQPALLALAISVNRPVPPDLDTRAASQKAVTILRRAPKHDRVVTGFGIRTPNQKPDVDAAGRSMIECIEKSRARRGRGSPTRGKQPLPRRCVARGQRHCINARRKRWRGSAARLCCHLVLDTTLTPRQVCNACRPSGPGPA